jgi:hypothetical protein
MISTSEGLSKERTPNSAASFREFSDRHQSLPPPKTGPRMGASFFAADANGTAVASWTVGWCHSGSSGCMPFTKPALLGRMRHSLRGTVREKSMTRTPPLSDWQIPLKRLT